MSDRSVFLAIFPPDNFKEVILVQNKIGQWGKPQGKGLPGGGRKGTESDEETGYREGEEETGLTRDQMEILTAKDGKPIIAYEKEDGDGHTKVVLIARVFDRKVPLKKETAETSDCRWFPVNALPPVQQRLTDRQTTEEQKRIRITNAKKMYESHFDILGKICQRFPKMPIIAQNVKVFSGFVHPKDRSEQPRQSRFGRGKSGQRGFGRDFGRKNFDNKPGNQDNHIKRYTYQR